MDNQFPVHVPPRTRPAPLVCAGTLVDDTGQPLGIACGRTSPARGATTDAEVREQARAGGWSVAGPAPFCDRCRKPNPEIARGLTTSKEK